MNSLTREWKTGFLQESLEPLPPSASSSRERLCERLRRIAQETASLLGKQVTLEVLGEPSLIPSSLEDPVTESLLHLIRNAIDHGIESTGAVFIRFAREGSDLVIECTDNGRGIDPARVVNRARALGMIAHDQRLRSEELLDLLLQPGFSTREEVTEVSGRGIGMDVVRENVKKMNGRISLHSAMNLGTTVRIQLSCTL